MTPATPPAPLAALLQTQWAEPVGSRSSLQGRLMGDVACRKAEPPALWTFWCLLVSRWWLSQDPTQVHPPPLKPSCGAFYSCQLVAQDKLSVCLLHSSLFVCCCGGRLPVCTFACLMFVHVCTCSMLGIAHQSCKRNCCLRKARTSCTKSRGWA